MGRLNMGHQVARLTLQTPQPTTSQTSKPGTHSPAFVVVVALVSLVQLFEVEDPHWLLLRRCKQGTQFAGT
jgi:hypothetical protein